jgi:hypothetical protein
MTRPEVSNNAILEDWISKPSIESMPMGAEARSRQNNPQLTDRKRRANEA